MSNGQAPTVHEVARRAQVSIATVSRVVRGVGQVAPETRRRVLEAIDELRYRPSHFGRALVERRHAALGIVFPGLSGPYYSEVIHGFEAEAVAARQSVLILGTHLLSHSEQQVLEIASRVDGLAILGGTISDTTVQQLVAEGIPVVLLARHPIDGIPAVRVENVQSTVDLTLHLLQVHHYERLVFVGNPTRSPDCTDRWHGFLEAHRQAGVEPPAEPIRVGFEQADGLMATSELLNGRQRPHAVVCANDEIALGAYGAASARRIRIPRDLAITGWDDILMAGLISPGLTTVRQPLRELGSRTAQLLLARTRGETDGGSDVLLPTRLVIRSSCGCGHEKHRSRRPAKAGSAYGEREEVM